MRRHVLTTPDGLDIRELAEAAARRAGLTLDQWIAALQADRPATGRLRPTPDDELDAILARLGKTGRPLGRSDETPAGAALDSVAGWIAQAEERIDRVSRQTADHQSKLAASLSDALIALRNRLDGVERRTETERAPPPASQIVFPVREAAEALAPLSDTLAGLRTDMARLTDRLEQPLQVGSPPGLDGIRSEIERLQGTVDALATRDEITGLEEQVRSLAATIAADRGPADMALMAASVSDLQTRLDRTLASHADAVHQKVSSQIERLRDRINRAAETGIDRTVIDFLSSQIVDLRQDLAHRAEPAQIAGLSGDIAALTRQFADLRQNQVGRGDFAALKGSLEDICGVLTRTVEQQAATDVSDRLQDLGEKIDRLANRPDPAPPSLEPMARQLALLTERMGALNDGRKAEAQTLTAMMERLSGDVRSVAEKPDPSPEPLFRRFDRIEEELRQVGQQADTSAMELMLRTLAEKLEQRPLPDLRPVESRIADLADRLSTLPPHSASQANADEAIPLKGLQEEASRIAESAARTALQEVRAQIQAPAAPEADLDAFKQGLVELKALHIRSDKKTHQTLQAVHDALANLIDRFAAHPKTSPAMAVEGEAPASAALPVDRLEAAVRKLHAAAISQAATVSMPAPDGPVLDGPMGDRRAGQPPAPQPEAPRKVGAAFASGAGDTGGLRASFIAAARRATQTIVAAQDAGADRASDPEALDAGAEPNPEPQSNLIERLKKTLEGHKRPLLFGLAALLLASGTAQVFVSTSTAGAVDAIPVARAAAPVPAALTAERARLIQPVGFGAGVPVQAAPQFRLDPSSLGTLPQGLPEALSAAALGGDASAVHEIASRAADGRGQDKDPALAARLMERAARAGLAPAQERLAMFYEKGFGLARDTKMALTWYERAATGGNTRAMHNLATLLAAGAGGKPDYAAALRWYLEAAEAGVRDSQFNIGVLFARAVGTRPDLTQSYKWFALAAAQGDPEAGRKRDEMAARLNPSDLASVRIAVERWRPRAVDISANEVAIPAESASLRVPAHNRI